MSEPDNKSRHCLPEPNDASSKIPELTCLSLNVSDNNPDYIANSVSSTAPENDVVSFCKMFDLDCQSGNESKNGSTDDFEEESSDDSDYSLDSLSQVDCDASRPKALGSPQGQCERCKKREASQLCCFCGTGKFCSAWCCEMSHEMGKHKCVPTEDTTAKNLIEAVGMNVFPEDRQTLEDYFLTIMASSRLGDPRGLLSIYRNLVVAFQISSPQLHQWKEAKQIFNNIVRLYNRYPRRVAVLYFYWLSRHSHVFLEEDKSEVLDFDAYLRAHDLTPDQFYAILVCNL